MKITPAKHQHVSDEVRAAGVTDDSTSCYRLEQTKSLSSFLHSLFFSSSSTQSPAGQSETSSLHTAQNWARQDADSCCGFCASLRLWLHSHQIFNLLCFFFSSLFAWKQTLLHWSQMNTPLPVREDVQHSLGGGEGSIRGEEDGDEGGVSHGKWVEEVEHQLLLRPSFHTLGARHRRLEDDRKERERKLRITASMRPFLSLVSASHAWLTIGLLREPCCCLTTTV